MDTLSVFLLDLEHRWGWRGQYPDDQHTVQLLQKHLGVGGPPIQAWCQTALLQILEALVKRALAAERREYEAAHPIAFDDPIGGAP